MDNQVYRAQSVRHRNDKRCTVLRLLGVISGRWAIPILYMLFSGKKRFGELQRSIPNINTRMLTRELKSLECSGLLVRTVYPTVPPRVEYELTEVGRSIEPHLMGLYHWAKEHLG